MPGLTKNAIVDRCFDFLPHLACLPFSTNPLSGSALKKQPDLTMCQVFSDEYPVLNSSNLSIQEVIVS